jgi:C-terminal processing protease CtpA/Prc
MYLKKGKNFSKPPSIFTNWGSTGFVTNPANFEVVKVDPNGPAYEKGIREKDILIKINNRDISYMGIVEFQKSLSKLLVSEDGKRTLTFKRGDETFTVEFTRKSRKEIQD